MTDHLTSVCVGQGLARVFAKDSPSCFMTLVGRIYKSCSGVTLLEKSHPTV